MANHAIMDDASIKLNGIKALNKALGHAGALRFMSMSQREPTDYVQISRKLYDGKTVDAIFERAKTNWKTAKH